MISMTVVQSCACKHTFQDREYGVGQRVHNIGGKSKKAVCTVCLTKK